MSGVTVALEDGILAVELARPPLNEIGLALLDGLEDAVGRLDEARAVVIASGLDAGFCAGADLRELYREGRALDVAERTARVRAFLERIHAVLDRLDAAPVPVIGAIHGPCFGGGFELALCCDVLVADKTARFAFPELRLGLIPGFGGIPRLRRDVSNALVRDLLLTGRSIGAPKALDAGLVAQVVAPGAAGRAARAAAKQACKFDATATRAAKKFVKPLPREECREEIEIFLELFARDTVQAALKKFVEDEGPMPYLP